MNVELGKRLAAVETLFLDVDGIMTDGRIHFLEDGAQFRSFDVTDGLGMKMLRRAGIRVVIVSAGKSEAVVHRARQLQIDHVFQGVTDKKKLVEHFLTENNLNASSAAFMGDDITDIEAMKHVGVALTVPGARPEALAAAHYVTNANGGQGAVREVCELILHNSSIDMTVLHRE